MGFFSKKNLNAALDMASKACEATAEIAMSAATIAKEKSELAIKMGKIKKDIFVEKAHLEDLYEMIGKRAYEMHESGIDGHEELNAMFVSVKASLDKIAGLEADFEALSSDSDEEITVTEDEPIDQEVESLVAEIEEAEAKTEEVPETIEEEKTNE